MPAATQDFGSQDFGAKRLFSLDYVNNLAPGESLVSGSWTLSVVPGSGSDSLAPQSRVAGGSSAITGSVISSPLIDLSIGIITTGTKYLLVCAATTSTGEIIPGFAHFIVNVPA